MSYKIVEPWRPLRKEDGRSLDGVAEAFIEKLGEGRTLLYERASKRKGMMGLPLSYYAQTTDGLEEPNLIAKLAEGKIAMHSAMDAQGALLATTDLPGYLLVIAENLDGLLPHFENIPATNQFYQQEIETLRKLQAATERLRTGELTDEDKALFWLADDR